MDETLFKKAEIKVQKKSGFDKSHLNLLTTKVGTLTPILCDEVMPNSTVNLKLNMSASLPPLASDTFMRVDLKAEAFFVPYRLCYGGFEEWLMDVTIPNNTPGQSSVFRTSFPVMGLVGSNTYAAGTLSDYLGYRCISTAATPAQGFKVNPLPYVAYHKVWDDWYRNSLIQRSCFTKFYPNSTALPANSDSKWNAGTLPSYTFVSYQNTYNVFTSASNYAKLSDGKYLTDLRQRNFGVDYFTTATPNAQNGAEQSVSFNVPLTGDSAGSGNFTIAALRAANSMQQFLERNNLAGNRFVDYLRAQYGANLNDGVAQRSLLLGSATFNVYSKGVYQTGNNSSASGYTNNPMSTSVAAQFGSAYASGSDFIIKGFTANEPGVILVLVSLVPRVTYSTGIRRMFTHYLGSNEDGKSGGQVDMANPILQNTGNQPIFAYELNGYRGDSTVFGYTDKYAEWKDMTDELHGLLRDGQSLESFALQRSFDTSGQTINTSFLEIPTNYMDQVSAVANDISKYGAWIDSYLDYKVSMPLARYCVPSLQDPAYEHGESVVIDRGGRSL